MKSLAINKKASFDYIFLEKIESGIVLNGDEVKSILNHSVNFANSFVRILDNEAVLLNCHIGYYKFAKHLTKEQVEKYAYRTRKLLLKKRQIDKLETEVKKKNLTIVPVQLYLNDKGKIKLEIALAKGKKQYDKRETEKQKDFKREKMTTMKLSR